MYTMPINPISVTVSFRATVPRARPPVPTEVPVPSVQVQLRQLTWWHVLRHFHCKGKTTKVAAGPEAPLSNKEKKKKKQFCGFVCCRSILRHRMADHLLQTSLTPAASRIRLRELTESRYKGSASGVCSVCFESRISGEASYPPPLLFFFPLRASALSVSMNSLFQLLACSPNYPTRPV